MIENTLSTKFIPATNLQGDMVSADWRFLLPSLHVDRLLCVDVPPAPNIAVLSTIADEVVIACDDKQRLQQFEKKCLANGVEHFEFRLVQDYCEMPFEPASFSVVRFTKRTATEHFLRDERIQEKVATLLRDGAVLSFETRSYQQQAKSQASIKRLSGFGLEPIQQLWLTPFSGEMRTALPVGQNDISRFFFGNVLYGQSFKKRAMSRVGYMLSHFQWVDGIMPRQAFFLQKNPKIKNEGALPEFLGQLANTAGLDFSGHRFGLSTRGKYNANKPIYYLFKEDKKRPDAVIKMTRASEFNYRLENESRVLESLKQGNYVPADTYPEPLFFDRHNGLTVLAQKAVHGVPFRTRTQATPDCPFAHQAVQWLLQLGENSKGKTVSSRLAAKNLNSLFKRFSEIYPLTPAESRFLESQLETIRSSSSEFPLLFQHGDPGTWNILISDDDRVIFIDWEAGEPNGMPLWDLFYFMRTFASWVSRTQGSRDPLVNFEKNFFTQSAFVSWLARIIPDYCDAIGLEPRLVEPLFYTCWMHRSLKEAARLTQETITQGHYFNVLKMSMKNKDAPGLQQMLSAGKSNTDESNGNTKALPKMADEALL